jgi:aryl-alcohol dehydrogenase-like predicted oxidoreductase
MDYRPLGTSGLNVSTICLGTMNCGQQNTEADAHDQIDMALDQGVNIMDTAEMYPVPISADSCHLTEVYIGTWFAKNPTLRDKWILATKIAGPSGRLHWLRDGNLKLDRNHLTQAIEGSLKRLQTDYIDLYQLHWPHREVNNFGKLGYQHQPNPTDIPLEETLGVLQDFVQQGKIRHIGLCNDTAWGVMHGLNLHQQKQLPRVQSVQNPYSLLNRSYEVGLAEVSIREQCGLLAYSPLGMGQLTGKYLEGGTGRLTWRPDYYTRYKSTQGDLATKAYVEVAKKHGLHPTDMALAFVNQQPFVTSNIIGATTLEQLQQNIRSVQVTLTPEVLADINAVHAVYSNPCP